jgi:ubiquinone/menaquinone biosynthesis C-methylase UbiE
MPYKFRPEKKRKLDSEERRRVLPPHETLRRLGLGPGETVADVGCGVGYFSLPAAEIVGSAGRVFALDTSDDMLEELRKRLRDQGIRTVEPRRSGETTLGLPEGSVGFVLLSNVLHEIDGLDALLSDVHRVLKPEGRVAIIEWKKVAMEDGPPVEHRLSPGEVQGHLERAALGEVTYLEINSQLYGLTARKVP